MQIIRKYGGASADASWVNELSTIEKKQRPTNYLESPKLLNTLDLPNQLHHLT